MPPVKNHQQIKDFVRRTLGCGCPEEVFSDINLTLSESLSDRPAMKRLLIGRRLLIILLPCLESAIPSCLPQLVQEVRKERDDMGYNRVRIVLSLPQPSQIQPSAGLLFPTLAGVDDRMHLHILHTDDVRGIE